MAEVRKRLGNFILGEDDQTLEGVVLEALAAGDGSLAVVETYTGGQIAARIAPLPGAERVFRRGLVARDPAEIAAALGLDGALIAGEMSRETAEAVARAIREETGASHALALLIEVDDGPDRIDFGGSIHLAIAGGEKIESRRARIYGGRDWVRLGAVELGLDCLRRYLQGSRLPNARISNGCDPFPGAEGISLGPGSGRRLGSCQCCPYVDGATLLAPHSCQLPRVELLSRTLLVGSRWQSRSRRRVCYRIPSLEVFSPIRIVFWKLPILVILQKITFGGVTTVNKLFIPSGVGSLAWPPLPISLRSPPGRPFLEIAAQTVIPLLPCSPIRRTFFVRGSRCGCR